MLEFDYLRALVIVLIVLGHSIHGTGNGFPIVLENALRGGTAVFVFISGFFFHAVFYPRFHYKKFMLKKWQNVAVPFLIVSAIGLLYRVADWWFMYDHDFEQLGADICHTLKFGHVLYPHWYIPFIMLVFVLSPLYLRYIALTHKTQIGVLLLSCLIAVFIHRPHANANLIQSLLFFTPFYFLGILYSIHKAWLEQYRRQVFLVCLAGFTIALGIQSYIDPHIGNYHKNIFYYNGIDWIFIQRVFLCFLMVEMCRWLCHGKKINVLSQIGDMSFAIFFLHPFFTIPLDHAIRALGLNQIQDEPMLSMGITLVKFCVHMLGAIGLALIIRRSYPQRSRSLIGW